MKAVFTTNDQSESSYELLKTAIHSLQANTTLTPVVIWSGNHQPVLEWLSQRGVEIIYHKLSFDVSKLSFKNLNIWNPLVSSLYTSYPTYHNENFIYTESLRIDIPLLFNDDWVLYCDCDTLFLNDPVPILNRYMFDFHYLGAVLREDLFFNNGIMFFNLKMLRGIHPVFVDYYLKSGYQFPRGHTTTQGLYNSYFYDKPIFHIPSTMNWFADWGINPASCIIHFCGPKPHEYAELKREHLTGVATKFDKLYHHKMANSIENGNVMEHYVKEWNKYAESPVPIS